MFDHLAGHDIIRVAFRAAGRLDVVRTSFEPLPRRGTPAAVAAIDPASIEPHAPVGRTDVLELRVPRYAA